MEAFSGVRAACFLSLAGGIGPLLCDLKFPAFSIWVQRMLMENSGLRGAVQTDTGFLGVLLPPDPSVFRAHPARCSPASAPTLLPASPWPGGDFHPPHACPVVPRALGEGCIWSRTQGWHVASPTIGTACGEEALVLVTDVDPLNAPQSGPG